MCTWEGPFKKGKPSQAFHVCINFYLQCTRVGVAAGSLRIESKNRPFAYYIKSCKKRPSYFMPSYCMEKPKAGNVLLWHI